MTNIGNDLYMSRGDDERVIVLCPARPFEDGDNVTITIRTKPGCGDIVLCRTVSSFVDGAAYIPILPEDTNNLAFGAYSYDVQVRFHDYGTKTIIKPAAFVIGEENTYDEQYCG